MTTYQVESLYLKWMNSELSTSEYLSKTHDLLTAGEINEQEWYYATHLVTGLGLPPDEHRSEASTEFVSASAIVDGKSAD